MTEDRAWVNAQMIEVYDALTTVLSTERARLRGAAREKGDVGVSDVYLALGLGAIGALGPPLGMLLDLAKSATAAHTVRGMVEEKIKAILDEVENISIKRHIAGETFAAKVMGKQEEQEDDVA